MGWDKATWIVVVAMVDCASREAAPVPPVTTAIVVRAPAPSSPAAPVDAGVPEVAQAPTREVVEEPATKNHEPWKLITPCVDPVADAKKRLKRDFLSMEPDRRDIDMDGEPDWVITTDADAFEYRGYVYLARGSCGHFAGAWTQGGVTPSADGKELTTEMPCKHGCCAGDLTRYVWDGRT